VPCVNLLDVNAGRSLRGLQQRDLQSVLGADVFHNHRLLSVDAQSSRFHRASDVRLDVAELEARCGWAEQLAPPDAERQAALYRQAVALYRTDLLIDCYDD
jgi:hypothetical protein